MGYPLGWPILCLNYAKILSMNLRVMTFNIRNGLAADGPNTWENRRQLTAQVIRNSQADIVGLQEVFDFQLDYLMRQLPEYEVYSVGRDDGQRDGEACSIVWKQNSLHAVDRGTFWLSDTPDIPGSMSWGNHITRICSWVEFAEGFRVFNTHWDHESVPARRNSARQILNELPETPWVLMGDFNAEPNSAEIMALRNSPHVKFASGEKGTGTFHNFGGGTSGEDIDHIFTSNHWEFGPITLDDSHVDEIYPSDHYPVTINLNLR